MENSLYKNKYLKYKSKYLDLKKKGGGRVINFLHNITSKNPAQTSAQPVQPVQPVQPSCVAYETQFLDRIRTFFGNEINQSPIIEHIMLRYGKVWESFGLRINIIKNYNKLKNEENFKYLFTAYNINDVNYQEIQNVLNELLMLDDYTDYLNNEFKMKTTDFKTLFDKYLTIFSQHSISKDQLNEGKYEYIVKCIFDIIQVYISTFQKNIEENCFLINEANMSYFIIVICFLLHFINNNNKLDNFVAVLNNGKKNEVQEQLFTEGAPKLDEMMGHSYFLK